MTRPLWAPWRLAYIERPAVERDGCVFCLEAEAALGDDSLLIHCGARCTVILNRFPYAPGHVMVSPVRHVAELGELDDAEALELHRLTTRSIAALRALYEPHAFNVGWNLGSVAGGSISGHLHQHVVPRWSGDVNFMPVLAEVKVMPEHLLVTRERLREAFAAA
ncbi:MAG: HIT domain-containing protein [Actinobacteria bacterium]|nr:HIT domain-containing protein [Actinomycetota bacterium]